MAVRIIPLVIVTFQIAVRITLCLPAGIRIYISGIRPVVVLISVGIASIMASEVRSVLPRVWLNTYS